MKEVDVNHIDNTIARMLDWKEFEGCWFDKDGHYKEEYSSFSPAMLFEDAFYVLERLGYNWVIETDTNTVGDKIFNCLIYIDEGRIEESHSVDTCYIGASDTVPLAICRAVIKANSNNRHR